MIYNFSRSVITFHMTMIENNGNKDLQKQVENVQSDMEDKKWDVVLIQLSNKDKLIQLKLSHIKYIFELIFIIFISSSYRFANLDAGMDIDEGIYLPISQSYAEAIRSGNWSEIITDTVNNEHPQLLKILFAFGILLNGNGSSSGYSDLEAARCVSIYLAIGVAILLHKYFGIIPALIWSISSWSIKYTSEAYLDSGVTFFSLCAIIMYFEWTKRKKIRWLILSSIFSSMAFASKYSAFIMIFTILIAMTWYLRSIKVKDMFSSEESNWITLLKPYAIYALIGGISFFIFSPRNIHFDQFIESLGFHRNYSMQEGVNNENMYAQFIWIFGGNNPTNWSDNFPVSYFDDLIILLAFIGFGIYFYQLLHSTTNEIRGFQDVKKHLLEVSVLFFVANTLFLLLWPTKWPQYLVYYMVPCAIMAGSSFYAIWDSFINIFQNIQVIPENPISKKIYFLNWFKKIPASFFILIILGSSVMVVAPYLQYTPMLNEPLDPIDTDSPNTNSAKLNWTIVEVSGAPNSMTIVDEVFIWTDAGDDDTGDGDYTYPSDESFASGTVADILQVQVRFSLKYVVVSVQMQDFAEIGWNSPLGIDMTAMYIGIDTDRIADDNEGINGITDAEMNFNNAVEILVSLLWDLYIDYYTETGSLSRIDPGEESYQVNTQTNWIQIALDREFYGIADSFNIVLGTGLEELGSTREVLQTQEEWYGGGADNSAEDSDFYDLAFISSEDQISAITNNIAPEIVIDIKDLA